jgi:hypothetical protein
MLLLLFITISIYYYTSPNGFYQSSSFQNGKKNMKQITNPSPFWKLPTELRLQIWELSLPDGRVIKVHVDEKRSKAYLVDRLPLPSLLHVCRDSRSFVLMVFRRGFQNTPESRNNFGHNLDRPHNGSLRAAFVSAEFVSRRRNGKPFFHNSRP